MDYIPLSDNAARQVIDSTTLFNEVSRVESLSRQYSGGMYWKRQGEYEYLVKTGPDNRQRRIGPRSASTEKTHLEFVTRKAQLESRLKPLRAALIEAERMNKALKAGRTPATVVSILQALRQARLDQHFVVVGTHALYAYEAAAGVRIVQGALATQDVDLLWDARKRLQFLTDLERMDSSMLRLLQRADASFQRKEGHPETAISARGSRSISCAGNRKAMIRIPSGFRMTRMISGPSRPSAHRFSRMRRVSNRSSSRPPAGWR